MNENNADTSAIPDIIKKWMFGEFELRDDVAEVLERYFAKMRKGFSISILRSMAWDLMALSALREDYSPDEIAKARDAGKFIESDDLCNIEPGDSYEVDHILMSLRDAGFDAGYASIVSTKSLSVSVFFMGAEELGVVSSNWNGPMVEEWDGSMCEVPEEEG